MSKFIDLTGKQFGRLTVIKRAEDHVFPSKQRQVQYLCRCIDNNIVIVLGTNLKRGLTISCGCYKKQRISETHFIDIKGKSFGKLIVIKRMEDYISPLGDRKVQWLCRCQEGNEVIVASTNLKSGKVTSCGCLLESTIATEVKRYYVEKYDAITEYKKVLNPKTNRYLSYDIFIPKINIYIEINGDQHYIEDGGLTKLKAKRNNRTCKEEFLYSKELDNLKIKYAKKNGTYIEVDLRKIKTIEEAINYIQSYL